MTSRNWRKAKSLIQRISPSCGNVGSRSASRISACVELVQGDATKLSRAGWGVIFAHDADPAIREALRATARSHRRAQAAEEKEHYYQEYSGVRGYRPGESKQQFLARHGAGPGPADPEKVPYYLLLVGDPGGDPVPLPVPARRAVRRRPPALRDRWTDYARYARERRRGRDRNPRCPRTAGGLLRRAQRGGPGDAVERRSSGQAARRRNSPANRRDGRSQTLLGEEATKARLGRLLGGAETPPSSSPPATAWVFRTATRASWRIKARCSARTGPAVAVAACRSRQDFYFAGDDVGDDRPPARADRLPLRLLRRRHAALDDFAHLATGATEWRSPRTPFSRGCRSGCSATPTAARWRWSATSSGPGAIRSSGSGAGEQLEVFEGTLLRLLRRPPLGRAIEFFNERYAELSSDLSNELEEVKFGKTPDDFELAGHVDRQQRRPQLRDHRRPGGAPDRRLIARH